MLLTVGPNCPPTSAQAGSFLPGWEIALAWNFSAGVGWGGECFWRQVQNLQLPAFLRQIQRRRDKDCTVSGGSGGGGRGGEEEMAVPDKASQPWSHPQGPSSVATVSPFSCAAGEDNAKVHNRHPESWNARVGRASDQPTHR